MDQISAPAFVDCFVGYMNVPVATSVLSAARYESAPTLDVPFAGEQIVSFAIAGTLDVRNGEQNVADRALIPFMRVGRIVFMINPPRDLVPDAQTQAIVAQAVQTMEELQA